MNPVTLVMVNIILEIHNKGTWTTLALFCNDNNNNKAEKVVTQGEFNTAACPQTLKHLNCNHMSVASYQDSMKTSCILVFHFVFPYYSLFQLLQRSTPILSFQEVQSLASK